MRTRFPVAGLLLLATALVAGPLVLRPPPAAAADSSGGLRFFETEFKKMGKGVANKLWDVADDARKANLFQFAAQTADRVLVFNTNYKDAREYLGYVKQRKEWVLDEDAASKVKRQNSKNQKESQKTFDKKIEKWQASLAKVESYIATKYAQLGNACKTKGHGEQAQKAYERALLLDPNQAVARKALGHVKVGKLWMTKEQLEAINKSMEGQPVTEQSRLEKGLGLKLHKMESPHFRVEDDVRPTDLPTNIKGLETLYVYYLADIGIDPTSDVFDGKKAELCVVSTKPAWDKWVDDFSNAHDKEWTKGSNTYRDYRELVAGTFRVDTAETEDTRDPLLHHAAHFLGQAVWKAKRYAWLDEGLAYYYTVKVNNTTRTSCLSKEIVGDYGNDKEVVGGDKEWNLSDRWREYLRSMVVAKSDHELRTIMLTPLATLQLPDSVKSWAVVSWLMDTRRDQMLEYLRTLREDPKADQEALVRKVFGKEIELLDQEWRAYAVRAF